LTDATSLSTVLPLEVTATRHRDFFGAVNQSP